MQVTVLPDFIPFSCQEIRRHVREGDAGAGIGTGAGGEGEEGVLGAPLLLWHRPLQGSHLRPHPWQGLPLRHQGRVQECGQTHVLLYEHVTEIYSHIISNRLSVVSYPIIEPKKNQKIWEIFPHWGYPNPYVGEQFR